MTIQLQQASVVRNGNAIVDGLTCECTSGSLIAFCGQNGAGKTTAFSVMAGNLNPDSGKVLWQGQNLKDINRSELARCRAVVSQSSSLNFPFHVHEIVALGRTPHFGTPRQQHDDEVIFHALQAMDLLDFASRNFLTLSGGERKRVEIARALAQVWDEPDENTARWLFLDEPTSALDLRYQLKLMDQLRQFAADGWGVITVLHDLHLVAEYADRVWLFKQAKVILDGQTSDVLTGSNIEQAYDLDVAFKPAWIEY